MDLPAYHRALNLGFSESEASRIGDDAWENNRQQPTCDSEPEPDYCDVLVAENTRLRAELAEYKLSLGTIHAMAHRVSAWTIRRECERVMPELAALAAKGE